MGWLRIIRHYVGLSWSAKALGAAGYEWSLIDGPPGEMALIEQAVVVADFVR